MKLTDKELSILELPDDDKELNEEQLCFEILSKACEYKLLISELRDELEQIQREINSAVNALIPQEVKINNAFSKFEKYKDALKAKEAYAKAEKECITKIDQKLLEYWRETNKEQINMETEYKEFRSMFRKYLESLLRHEDEHTNNFIKEKRKHTIRPDKAGTPWTKEEDEQLIQEYKSKMKISEIAKIHQRTYVAIMSRLEKHGVIQ